MIGAIGEAKKPGPKAGEQTKPETKGKADTQPKAAA
jgi:hypothetical protein